MEQCPTELAFFDKNFQPGLLEKLHNLVSEKFGVVTYTQAVDILQKADADFQYPIEWGGDLQTEHERYLAEVVYKRPVFVTDYPKEIKSFYMKQNADGKTVAATDLLAPGVGEIIGGSEREADLDKLLTAMKERNMSTAEYEQYLDLRRFGSVPHGGFGLGFERLLMYVTGIENIRDVILFPRVVKKIF
ncbi:MAG: asparagine--tRNA ligase, partial [Thermoguttaceae bacterium]|nr:asparagine--tRNA ligase [Thermoguttaceae bacterium]